MAIKLSDSIRVGQQKPLEDKYFNELVPYTSTTQVNTLLLKAVRHIGLTVNIDGEEYWYKDGIEDENLVLKVSNIDTFILKNQEQDDRLENLEGGLANKLDKGTYTGNASDLKSLIDTKADLVDGKVPATQLPSYVDDVLEFANLVSFPAIGESGKIYIAIDTNLTYRWGGSSYVVMSSSLALGETSSTAYRGHRGKIAYDHSQTTGNPHGTTKADIGLGNVPNVDATNPANITQSANYRFFTDTERTKLNSITGINTGDETNATILAKIGYTPEDVANKSLNVLSDKTSNLKFPSVKAVYDWGLLEFNKRLKSYTFSDYNSFPSFVEIDALYIDSTFGDLYIGWSDPNYVGDPTTGDGNVYKQIGIGKNVSDLENYYSKNVSDSRYVILQNGKVPASQSQPSTIVMNNSTYVITFTDATGAVQTIDLPLESLFKDANYNSSTKSLIVTLQDGTTRTIPLTDLVDLPEIVLATTNPAVTPTTGQKVYFNTSLGKVWFNVSGAWTYAGNLISDSEKANITTAYNHSQTSGNAHNTKVEELTDIGNETTSIADTDVLLKKEVVGGLWKKITFANFKNWFTTELAKKINIGLDTVFNFKNISAMTLTEFRSITPDVETIYFTEEQNGTGWQQVRYNGLGITIPATTETVIALTNENFIELDSDSTFNLIDVANTKINGIFEKDFVIIKFNAGVVTPATANQWFKVILKINGVQNAVSPVFYLTETSGTVEKIAHNFALNVPAEMVTNGATLHVKTSTSMTFNNPVISVARVHKSTNANL